MADISNAKITIDAPVARVQEILFDIGNYPLWSTSIKKAEVLSSDGQGRVSSAKLTIDAGALKDRVTLDYDWTNAPNRLEFSLADADLLTEMDGAYIIESDDEDTTTVTYELIVALSMPVPAMMRKKAEQSTIDLSLEQLKAHAEA